MWNVVTFEDKKKNDWEKYEVLLSLERLKGHPEKIAGLHWERLLNSDTPSRNAHCQFN